MCINGKLQVISDKKDTIHINSSLLQIGMQNESDIMVWNLKE